MASAPLQNQRGCWYHDTRRRFSRSPAQATIRLHLLDSIQMDGPTLSCRSGQLVGRLHPHLVCLHFNIDQPSRWVSWGGWDIHDCSQSVVPAAEVRGGRCLFIAVLVAIIGWVYTEESTKGIKGNRGIDKRHQGQQQRYQGIG